MIARLAVRIFYSPLDALEQLAVDKRLFDEIHGTGMQGRNRSRHVAVARQQNSRHLAPAAYHVLDQLNPTATRQVDLSDYTGQLLTGHITQQRLGVVKKKDVDWQRRDQRAERGPDCCVRVDDTDGRFA